MFNVSIAKKSQQEGIFNLLKLIEYPVSLFYANFLVNFKKIMLNSVENQMRKYEKFDHLLKLCVELLDLKFKQS